MTAQVLTDAITNTAPMKDQEHPAGFSSPLAELVREVEQSNPEIAAALSRVGKRHKCSQAGIGPAETEITVQQFSVGSPRPFAGYSNSDFA